MTDLEITRLCAEAIGPDCIGNSENDWHLYDPLHDDAQAMALVKRFQLYMAVQTDRKGDYWSVTAGRVSKHPHESCQTDLNRAICECVATMQNAKTIR